MEYTLDYAAIGKRVRKVRKERHLTQTELGDCCGVTSAHICHNVLQVSLDELLCDNLVTSKNVYEDALRDLLSQATAKQARLIAELARVVLHDRYGAGGAFPGSLKTDG